jgi:hypothetical protein
MSTECLQRFKSITTWGGVAATFCGIFLSYSTGGSLAAARLSTFGLLLTCFGHMVTGAVTKRQAIEKAADKRRLADLEGRIVPFETERKEWQKQIEENDKLNH